MNEAPAGSFKHAPLSNTVPFEQVECRGCKQRDSQMEEKGKRLTSSRRACVAMSRSHQFRKTEIQYPFSQSIFPFASLDLPYNVREKNENVREKHLERYGLVLHRTATTTRLRDYDPRVTPRS